jgi:RNA polymerase sigma-70 factor, ECF subfamily
MDLRTRNSDRHAQHRRPGAPIRVVVVDDHGGARAGVVRLLTGVEDIVVVGQAVDGHEVLQQSRTNHPDVVLMDVSMPVLDGIDATKMLQELSDPPAVVLFTALGDSSRLSEGLAAGAHGYVLKDDAPEVMVDAIRSAAVRRPAGPGRAVVADGHRLLVERAGRGDPDAWEVLYRGAYPKLLAYARHRLPPGEAADAVAETFLRAVDGAHRLGPGIASFDAWVFGIARHVITDAQRSALRRPPPTTSVEATQDGEPVDGLLGAEEAAALRRAFASLPASDRELLELRVIGDLSVEETAAIVGKRPGATRMAQARALGRLRALLEDGAPCAG